MWCIMQHHSARCREKRSVCWLVISLYHLASEDWRSKCMKISSSILSGELKVLCWHLIAAESSPTCVIGNPAIRSNSSSPTMSTTSKTSNDMLDRHSKYHEGRTRNKSTRTNCPPGGDEGVSFGTFLGSEIQKVLMAVLISSLRVSIFPEVLPSLSTLMMIPLAGQHREPQQ